MNNRLKGMLIIIIAVCVPLFIKSMIHYVKNSTKHNMFFAIIQGLIVLIGIITWICIYRENKKTNK